LEHEKAAKLPIFPDLAQLGMIRMSEPTDKPSPHPASDVDSSVADVKPVRWTSEAILQGQREAIIVHGEDEYRLRWTRNNKLILCK
jgi:hemin uptake protein HemP